MWSQSSSSLSTDSVRLLSTLGRASSLLGVVSRRRSGFGTGAGAGAGARVVGCIGAPGGFAGNLTRAGLGAGKDGAGGGAGRSTGAGAGTDLSPILGRSSEPGSLTGAVVVADGGAARDDEVDTIVTFGRTVLIAVDRGRMGEATGFSLRFDVAGLDGNGGGAVSSGLGGAGNATWMVYIYVSALQTWYREKCTFVCTTGVTTASAGRCLGTSGIVIGLVVDGRGMVPALAGVMGLLVLSTRSLLRASSTSLPNAELANLPPLGTLARSRSARIIALLLPCEANGSTLKSLPGVWTNELVLCPKRLLGGGGRSPP